MDQDGQDVIPTSYNVHVVLKLQRVDIHTLSREHPDDVILQSVEVHLDIGPDRVVRTCSGPVASIIPFVDCLHDRIGIEDVGCLSETVTVIPTFHLHNVHIVFLA